MLLQAYRKLWPIVQRVRADKDVSREFIRYNRIRVALGAWRASSGAMRSLLLIARNCGSPLSAEQIVTIDTITESQEEGVPQVFERWQNWRADPEYREMLAQVDAAGDRGYLLIQREMKPSVLKDYYKEEGVCGSVVFKILTTENREFVYASLNFGEPAHGKPLSENAVETHEANVREFFNQSERIKRKCAHGRSIWRG